MAFDIYLKKIRKDKNIYQVEMAKILDISRLAIKLIENDSTKCPSKKVLCNLSILLNETEINVMLKILFDDTADDKNELFIIRHYLAYMYLDRLNIVEHPYNYSIWNSCSIQFDGKIVKKSQPKNIVIVPTYKRELYRITEVKNKIDASGYIGDLVSKLMQVIALYRGIILVFDAENDEDKMLYDYISEIQINHNDFNIELVLYDKKIGINRVDNI